MTSMRRSVPLVGLIVLAACVGGPERSARTAGPAPAVELTRSGGCGDAFLWAATEDGTVAIQVSVEVPSHSTVDPTVVEIDLPDPEVDAVLLRGDGDLTRNFCVDVLDTASEPTETVPLIAGTGGIVTGPVPTDVPLCGEVDGSMELEGVVAEDGTRIAPVRAETTAIGCIAG